MQVNKDSLLIIFEVHTMYKAGSEHVQILAKNLNFDVGVCGMKITTDWLFSSVVFFQTM